MFEKSWIGYSSSSLFECLIVFAVLFIAGNLWPACARWCVELRTG